MVLQQLHWHRTITIHLENYLEGGPNVEENKYLYLGKELQNEVLGGNELDWFDFGSRFYDPELGRWHSINNQVQKCRGYNEIMRNRYQFYNK
ncbi:hypothetical protein EYV94_27870 [Puteibacter caeruleilacunae]|nr:hypothetical protein EYV94_27870 [Puteibacter caeruleilacunae]